MRWLHFILLAVGVALATPSDWSFYRRLGVLFIITNTIGLLVQALNEVRPL